MISARSQAADVVESGRGLRVMHYRKRRHPGRYVTAALALLVAAIVIRIFATSAALRWSTFLDYLFDVRILVGVGKTIILTALSMTLAVVVGVVLAFMRRSPDPTLRAISWLYVSFMRSVPLLVLILFTYFLAVLLPRLSIGIPFGGPQLWSVDTNSVISPLTASILALGLGQAAYTSEVIRGGIMAVDRGQQEAAIALGMYPNLSMRRIILPQAFRVIVPGLGNEAIGMFKATSLVEVIGYTELLTTAQRIYAINFETIPLLLVVTAWYLVLTTLATIGQIQLEKKMSRGF